MAKTQDPNSIVLVMDRADQDVEVMTSTLRKAGYDVTLCSEPRDIFKFWHMDHASTQLAIIDPETPGLAVSELLEVKNPKIRVLVVADRDLLDSAPDWTSSKNIRLSLPKPIRRATLLGSVLKVASEPLYRTA
jgi:DNA-binding NtrC family response regulator